ncbi:hypothetical protein GTV15_08530 [Streptomyces sp. SID7803]|nr:hypothetical protein [Streptomyces sp. SID7803]
MGVSYPPQNSSILQNVRRAEDQEHDAGIGAARRLGYRVFAEEVTADAMNVVQAAWGNIEPPEASGGSLRAF